MGNTQEIRTPSSRIFLSEDGIICKEFFPEVEETESDAKASYEAVRTISGGKTRPMIVDFTNLRKMDANARAFYADNNTWPSVNACAGITGSFVGKIISNFFLGLNKTPNPTKLFNSKEEAVAWLKQFQKD